MELRPRSLQTRTVYFKNLADFQNQIEVPWVIKHLMTLLLDVQYINLARVEKTPWPNKYDLNCNPPMEKTIDLIQFHNLTI